VRRGGPCVVPTADDGAKAATSTGAAAMTSLDGLVSQMQVHQTLVILERARSIAATAVALASCLRTVCFGVPLLRRGCSNNRRLSFLFTRTRASTIPSRATVRTVAVIDGLDDEVDSSRDVGANVSSGSAHC
jgi:hypothetical protein